MSISFVRADGGFTSPKQALTDRPSLIDLELQEGRTNLFKIIVYDDAGVELPCQPNEISILQGLSGLDEMQVLPYHIGIGRYFEELESERFMPAKGLEKNKTMPAVGTINGLKTTNEIRSGMICDTIRIPIYQGDYDAEGSTPELNNLVVELQITGENLPRTLSKGSPVDLTIKVDKSGGITIEADFRSIEHSEILQAEIKAMEAPSADLLESNISKAIQRARRYNLHQVEEQLKELQQQLQHERANSDGRLRLQEALRKQLLQIDPAERNAAWPSVAEDLKQELYDLEDLWRKIQTNGDDKDLNNEAVEQSLAEYRQRAELALKEQNLKEAKDVIRGIHSLEHALRNAVTGGAQDAQMLKYIHEVFSSLSWKNISKARELVQEGLNRIENGNNQVQDILIELIQRNLIHDDKSAGLLG